MIDGVDSNVVKILDLVDALRYIDFTIDNETGNLEMYDESKSTLKSCPFSMSEFGGYVVLHDTGAYSEYFHSLIRAYEYWRKDPVHRSLHGMYLGGGEATLVNFRKERRTNG